MMRDVGREDDALKYLELAVKENPRDHIAQAKLARAYGYKGRWSEAEHHFLLSLSIRPNDRTTQNWYERMKYQRSKYGRR